MGSFQDFFLIYISCGVFRLVGVSVFVVPFFVLGFIYSPDILCFDFDRRR